MRTRAISLFAAAGLAVALAAPAAADDETRVRKACAGGSAELRLKARSDETIEVELRVSSSKRATWRIVLLHERKLVFQGTRRATGAGYSFRVRRTVPDWPGRETVTASIRTTSGRACRLAATI